VLVTGAGAGAAVEINPEKPNRSSSVVAAAPGAGAFVVLISSSKSTRPDEVTAVLTSCVLLRDRAVFSK